MSEQSMDLYGQALLDYYNGEQNTTIILRRDDGFSAELPLKVFFARPAEFSRIEQLALDMCRGDVLDIGAGTGRHSLALQQRGLNPYAIDISAGAVEIIRRNGMKRAECADIFEFNNGTFDTLMMLLHGIGMTETLDGFTKFLHHARTLLKPGGQLIFDSMDVRCTEDAGNLAYQESNIRKNRYFGEIHLEFGYNGMTGKPWKWLHIDQETMTERARIAGWNVEIVHTEAGGDYLARLTLP